MIKLPLAPLVLNKVGNDISLHGRFNFRNQRPLQEGMDAVRAACQSTTAGQYLTLSLHADQMCTWARKAVMHLLHDIERAAVAKGFHANVLWTVDEGDDDLLELGEIFQELVPNVQFRFRELECCEA